MVSRSDELMKQVNELWRQAIDQLEEVKGMVSQQTGRWEADLHRLRLERDKLLKKLGEQTYKLANQGKVPLPAIVKATVDRLNEVIESLVAKQGNGKKRSTKKATKKKATAKKATRKKSASQSLQ